MIVKEFQGEFRFLSNFPENPIFFQGSWCKSNEHAYQAAKTLDLQERLTVQGQETSGKAKKAGKKVTLQPDWNENIDLIMMERINVQKYCRYPKLREKLLATGESELEEGNTWGDEHWGKNLATGFGKNYLGVTLMNIRDELGSIPSHVFQLMEKQKVPVHVLVNYALYASRFLDRFGFKVVKRKYHYHVLDYDNERAEVNIYLDTPDVRSAESCGESFLEDHSLKILNDVITDWNIPYRRKIVDFRMATRLSFDCIGDLEGDAVQEYYG